MMYTVETKFEDGSEGLMEHISYAELLVAVSVLDESEFGHSCTRMTIVPEKNPT
jgi:hypothetical protein